VSIETWTDVPNLVRRWRELFVVVNSKSAPEVEYRRGWFDISGIKYRRKQLEAMCEILGRRLAEQREKEQK
jgi:hypothetical protein